MKQGHKTNFIRFDIELTDEDIEVLNDFLTTTHRNRKSFGEALVKLALKAHKKGNKLISLNELGSVL